MKKNGDSFDLDFRLMDDRQSLWSLWLTKLSRRVSPLQSVIEIERQRGNVLPDSVTGRFPLLQQVKLKLTDFLGPSLSGDRWK